MIFDGIIEKEVHSPHCPWSVLKNTYWQGMDHQSHLIRTFALISSKTSDLKYPSVEKEKRHASAGFNLPSPLNLCVKAISVLEEMLIQSSS